MTTLDPNAQALVRLLVQISTHNPALSQWEQAFIAEIDALIHTDTVVRWSERRMALVRGLASKVRMPDPNTVWSDRLVRFTLELEERGVDSRIIGDAMTAAWASWDDM